MALTAQSVALARRLAALEGRAQAADVTSAEGAAKALFVAVPATDVLAAVADDGGGAHSSFSSLEAVVEDGGAWPRQALGTIGALLPKPREGEWVIGLLPET